jgi:hypothetical protein
VLWPDRTTSGGYILRRFAGCFGSLVDTRLRLPSGANEDASGSTITMLHAHTRPCRKPMFDLVAGLYIALWGQKYAVVAAGVGRDRRYAAVTFANPPSTSASTSTKQLCKRG